MRSFVVVVDMQRDFVMASGALPVPDSEFLLGPMREWLAALDPADIAGVLFTFDSHDPLVFAASPEGAEFPLHCVRGTAGWELVVEPDAIDPAIPVWRLEKGVFDMWAEAGLMVQPVRGDGEPVDRDAFFARLKDKGIDRVVAVGVAADYCVRFAVDGLLCRGFEVDIPVALTRGIADDARATAARHFGGSSLRLID